MIVSEPSTQAARPALVIVRNPATRDSRIIREADTLRRLGYMPLVLAVVSEGERTRHSKQDGIPVLRLSPTSPFSWAQRRLLRRRAGRPTDRGHTGEERNRGAGFAQAPLPRSLRSLAVRLHRWIRTIDFYRRAIGVVRVVHPTLIHCNDYNTMWIGTVARMITPAAVVYDAHELWPDRNLRPEPRWWLLVCEALFVRVAHRTITASPGYASVMARRYRIPPPRVVRNIPDLRGGAREPRRGQGARPDEATGSTLAYVGALTRNRGLEISIRAVARLPEARLRLIGPIHDSYRDQLTQLARDLDVGDRIEFALPVAPTKVIEALGTVDAGLALIQPVCLSYEMTLPNKLFEYVLAGLPVLGSDLPVIGSFIREHGVGLVASPDDAGDVASKLREILRPERNQQFRLASRKAAEKLRWESESRRLVDTYTEAITDATGRLRPVKNES